MVNGYKTISLPEQMYSDIENYMKENQKKGYSSITEFVKDSIRKNTGDRVPRGAERGGVREERLNAMEGTLGQSLDAVYRLVRRPRYSPIAFSDIIRASTGFSVVPGGGEQTQIIINSLRCLTTIDEGYGGADPAELSGEIEKRFEDAFKREAGMLDAVVERPEGIGYPDFILRLRERTSFIAFRVAVEGTKQREFYYATSKKMTSDGEHLLVEMDAFITPWWWKVTGYSVRDLSAVNMVLDAEFRASAGILSHLPAMFSYPDSPSDGT